MTSDLYPLPMFRSLSGWLEIKSRLPSTFGVEVEVHFVQRRAFKDLSRIGGIWRSYCSLARTRDDLSVALACLFKNYEENESDREAPLKAWSDFARVYGASERLSVEVPSILKNNYIQLKNSEISLDFFHDAHCAEMACGWDVFKHAIYLKYEGLERNMALTMWESDLSFYESLLKDGRIFQSPHIPSAWEMIAKKNLNVFLGTQAILRETMIIS